MWSLLQHFTWAISHNVFVMSIFLQPLGLVTRFTSSNSNNIFIAPNLHLMTDSRCTKQKQETIIIILRHSRGRHHGKKKPGRKKARVGMLVQRERSWASFWKNVEKWPNAHHQANHSKSLEHQKQSLADLYIKVEKWGILRNTLSAWPLRVL